MKSSADIEFNDTDERNLQTPSNGRLRPSYVWKDNEEMIGGKKQTANTFCKMCTIWRGMYIGRVSGDGG